jgi:hypothetical protein
MLVTILLAIALILFIVDAIGVASRVNLTPAGLAFLVGAMLAGHTLVV